MVVCILVQALEVCIQEAYQSNKPNSLLTHIHYRIEESGRPFYIAPTRSPSQERTGRQKFLSALSRRFITEAVRRMCQVLTVKSSLSTTCKKTPNCHSIEYVSLVLSHKPTCPAP